MSDSHPSLKLANESGYPLQIAVDNFVGKTTSTHKWSVQYREHSWTNPEDSASGYIDLVLQNEYKTIFLVLECKRVREATWVFMEPTGRAKQTSRAKAWITYLNQNRYAFLDWKDIECRPESAEGLFCAIKGQAANEKNTLLERTGAEITSAIEALAHEQREFRSGNGWDLKIYIGVIVTTADLQVARFKSDALDLENGTLATAEFESVPFVRLTKQLRKKRVVYSEQDYAVRLSPQEEKSNTVFVVKANCLGQFLSQFSIDDRALTRNLG